MTGRDEATEDVLIAAFCALLHEALPQAEQNRKWNAPNFSLGGQDIITLNLPPKGGVRIVFHRGAKAVDSKTGTFLVPDGSGRLKWATDQRAYAALDALDELEAHRDWLLDFARKWADAAVE